MLAQFIIAFVILGLLAGLTVGLAGVGSTLLILPTLVLLLPHYMPADLSVKISIATTLACTSVSVIFAAFIHLRKGAAIARFGSVQVKHWDGAKILFANTPFKLPILR